MLKIYIIALCYTADRLEKISLLTTMKEIVESDETPPSLQSAVWTSRSYKEAPYGEPWGEERFTPPVAARHLAVHNNGTEGVTLVELEVFGVSKCWHSYNVQMCNIVI